MVIAFDILTWSTCSSFLRVNWWRAETLGTGDGCDGVVLGEGHGGGGHRYLLDGDHRRHALGNWGQGDTFYGRARVVGSRGQLASLSSRHLANLMIKLEGAGLPVLDPVDSGLLEASSSLLGWSMMYFHSCISISSISYLTNTSCLTEFVTSSCWTLVLEAVIEKKFDLVTKY